MQLHYSSHADQPCRPIKQHALAARHGLLSTCNTPGHVLLHAWGGRLEAPGPPAATTSVLSTKACPARLPWPIAAAPVPACVIIRAAACLWPAVLASPGGGLPLLLQALVPELHPHQVICQLLLVCKMLPAAMCTQG